MEQDVELERRLRAHGYRVTGPRRAVWAALQRCRGHVTVEELLTEVLDAGDDADLASVYRALALFEELDLARVSRLGGSEASRWELAHPDEHFHLVCDACGEVDHHVGSLVAGIKQHLEQGHGFAPTRIELVVRGRCARCRQEAGTR